MPTHYSNINEPFEYHITMDINYKLTGRNPKTPLQLENELIDLINQTKHPIKYIGFIKEEKWKNKSCTVLYEYNGETFTTIYSNIIKFIKNKNWKPSHKTISNYKVDYKVKEIENSTGYKIIINSYKGTRSSFTITCDKHKIPYEWNNTYKEICIRGCAACAGVAPLTNDEILERVLDVCNEKKYKMENINYNKTLSTIDLTCEQGHTWNVGFRNFTHSRTNCPKCKSKDSKNFLVIDLLFNDAEIEKRFDECRNVRPLPFDRYVAEYNLLIEYDGSQHFDKSNRWYSDENKNRDNIKTQFAIDNNYNFLRISYRQDVEKVVKSYLQLLEENKNSQVVQIYEKIIIK